MGAFGDRSSVRPNALKMHMRTLPRVKQVVVSHSELPCLVSRAKDAGIDFPVPGTG